MSNIEAAFVGGLDLASFDAQHQGPEPLVDSAISHLEKLRRVIVLEQWITEVGDDPVLAGACQKWRVERERLIAELHLQPS
ncbi:MAG TPA: hypothetical protein VMG11_00420 [Steroidobacteraceae bacterium]|nr:hypothetical protein [Steroidobacteraceae bacterium]